MQNSVIPTDDGSQKNPGSNAEYDTIDLTDLDDKVADPDYRPDYSPGSSSDDGNNASTSVSTSCPRKRPLDPDPGCSKDFSGMNEHPRTVCPTEDYNSQTNGKLRSCRFCGKLCSCLIQHVIVRSGITRLGVAWGGN